MDVQKSGADVIATTVKAALTEAVESSSGEFEQTLNKTNITKINSPYCGINLIESELYKTNDFYLNMNVILADADQDTTTKGDQIRLLGSLEIGPKIIGEFKIKWFKLEKLESHSYFFR